jgi:predicted dithiol-disulfide oxidoreductase (DUF899 family)
MSKDGGEHQVVSPAEWLKARKELLAEEKKFTRLRDQLAQKRRGLPWVRVEKDYVFDGPGGKEKLSDLFGGRSQLMVYHFMFGPDWKEGCPSCSLLADNFDGSVVHLAQRDVTFIAASRAPLGKIDEFKKRMGWGFKWVSSEGNDFNADYQVSANKANSEQEKYYNYGTGGFPSEERPGLSSFYKDRSGQVFHTYSTYARGLEDIMGIYAILDRAPKGRSEEGLPHGMAWVRHHDKYSDGRLVDLKSQSTAR